MTANLNVSNKQLEYRWVRAGVRMSQSEDRYAAGHTPEWGVVHLKYSLTCFQYPTLPGSEITFLRNNKSHL